MNSAASPSLLESALADFLDQTAARQPTPGGGAVVALSLALAAAMARMVTAYSTRAEKPELEALLKRFADIDLAARQCVDDDVAAYAAYRAARSGSAEQQQAATLQAIAVPVTCLELAHELASLLDAHRDRLNPRLVSDTRIAAQLTDAAARGAQETIDINLPSLDDLTRRGEIAARCGGLIANTAQAVQRVCAAGKP